MRLTRALLTCALALAVPAAATTSADLCPNAPNPCVIPCATARVAGTVTLDFGQCDLVVGATGRLRIAAGANVLLRARSVRLATGAQLDGGGTAPLAGAGVRIETTGAFTIEPGATVDVSGSSGGTFFVRAGGDARLAGPVTGTALASAGRGALIGITAAGALTVERPIDVTGGTGDGGDVDLDGATVAVTAALTLDGSSPGGGGGDFTANAGRGTLTLAAPISASGARGTINTGGGTGGDVALTASGDIRLATGMSLTAAGGGPDGDGGRIDVDADGAVVQQGTISASTTGTGSGGSISLSGRTLSSTGTLTATGGSGGDIDLAATGSATVAAAIDAGSTGGDGDGGGVTAKGNPLLVTGTLAANADTRRDVGGSVTLSGCGVTLAGAAELDAKGVRGLNLVQAAGAVVVSGTLDATPGGGNRVEWRDRVPAVAPGKSNPVAVIVQNAALPACPAPPTTTSTTTSTVTTSTRPTTTSTSVTSTTSSTLAPGATTTTSAPGSTLPTTSTTVTSATTSTSTIAPVGCAPVDCDDGDACTLDACVDGVCEHAPVEDLDAVTCRLDDMVADVSATPVGRTTAAIRERLLARISATRRVVERARPLGRRRSSLLGRADRRLKGLAVFVERARAIGRLDPDVAAALATLIDEARAAIVALR